MRQHQGHGKHKSPDPEKIPPSLDAALASAWANAQEDAKAKNERAGGEYKVDIFIEADNPIHTYSVVISPVGN